MTDGGSNRFRDARMALNRWRKRVGLEPLRSSARARHVPVEPPPPVIPSRSERRARLEQWFRDREERRAKMSRVR